MFSAILDERGAALLTAVMVVSLALLALLVIFWIIRLRRPKGHLTREVGGRREPRLAVLDTAPVDARRRLVLIRRDDIEHLLMIGGPNDLVIESRGVQRESEHLHRPQPVPEPTAHSAPPESPVQPVPEPSMRQTSPEPTRSAPAGAPATGNGDRVHALQEPPGRIQAAHPPEQFPPERFAAAGTQQQQSPRAKGVEPGNPFDEHDFGAILDEQLAQRDREDSRVDHPLPRQQPAAEPVIPPDSPARRNDQDNSALEQEMARLLRDMTASRR